MADIIKETSTYFCCHLPSMPDFIEIICSKEERYYFSFTKKETQVGIKYLVETSKLNKPILFEMELG